MSARVWALLPCALLLAGCNQLLGIEESDVASDTQLGVACENTAQCQDGQTCQEGHCHAPGGEDMDATTPPPDATTQPPKHDAGDARVVEPTDAGDAGGDAGDATPEGPEAKAPECESDARRCEGAAQIQRSLCVEGFWQAEDPCENGELCDNATGECAPVIGGCSGREPGDAFCTGRERVVCGPDLVTAERETCPTVDHCQGSTDGKCLPCIANEHRCEGDELQVCNATLDGFDAVMTCDSAPCNADLAMCTNLVCVPDQYSCNTANNTLRLCNADGSAYLEQTACNDGICDAAHGQCDVCAAGEFSCANGTDVKVCDADGQNVTMETCTAYTSATTPLCSDALAACVGCIAPTSTCVGAGSQQSCTQTGSWDTPVACVDQTCYQGQCAGHCGPNVPPRCAAGGGSEACGTNGEWSAVENAAQCPVCIGDGVCVACTNGDTRCDDAGHQSTCVNNAWDVSTACVDKTCVGKACTGECSPGQSECRADGRYTCNGSGMYTRAQACSMCQEEPAGARCVTCQLGTYQCMNADLYRCNDQQTGWAFVNTCSSAALCDQNAGRCTNQVCNPNQVTCVGSELRTCNGTGSAYTTQTCSGTFNICDAQGNSGAGQCDRCVANAKSCTGASSRTQCSTDGQTTTPTTCSGTTPACYNGDCTACNPNTTTTVCDGLDKMRSCQSDGSLSAASTCVHTTCTSGMCQGNCAQGEARCATGGTVREKCGTSGDYVFDMTCPGVGGVCIGSGSCVACANGATRCENTSRQYTCSGNSWGSSFACTNQTCFGDTAGLGGRCQGSCKPGDKMCVSGQRAFDPCGGTGQPDSNSRTTCSGNPATDTTWQVCRDQAGASTAACTTAPTTLIGYPDASTQGTAESSLLNFEWEFQPVTVPGTIDLKVTSLTAAIKSVSPAGNSMMMMIFSQRRDSSTGALQPDRRLGNTSLSTAVAGNVTLPLSAPLTLTAGATYWLGVRILNGDVNDVPDTVLGKVYAYTAAAGTYIRLLPSPPNNTPPDPFPSTVPKSGLQLGLSGTGKPVL